MKSEWKPAEQATMVARWNERHRIGAEVNVTRDDGSIMSTRTRSDAWLLGGHTAVIMVEGITGGYALERVSENQEHGR